MAFNPLLGQIVAKTISQLPDKPSIIDLGNQTLTIRPEEFDSIYKVIETLPQDKKDKIDFKKLTWIQNSNPDQRPSQVQAYYLALGFSKYVAIDMAQRYGSLNMDLNFVLKDHYNYSEQFDLVNNMGTGEHIFNQHSVFTNVHNLAKKSGLMIHVLPFLGYINHGFFAFQPTIFGDLARANKYELLEVSLSNRTGQKIHLDPKSCFGLYGKSGEDFVEKVKLATSTHGSNQLIVCVMRKTTDTAFVTPVQGLYKNEIAELAQ